MDSFLKLTARHLFDNYLDPQKGLSGITAVFPNRRARLFFDEELSRCCTTPVWSPEYTTISDLFQSQSDLRIADRVELVTILYDIYCRIMHSTESLDSFWSWGELMISDFDDIDRNMALSGQLFQALSDQKELSDMSFLTEEQADALTRFFGEMKDCAAGPGKLKKEYDRIWKSLGEIYTSFSAELSARGLAYSGMLQRRVIENLDTDRFTSDRYAFIGFNSLDKAEKALFSALRDAGKAVFYWDHDEFYTGRHSVHEAGRFMRENLTMFPGELDGLPLFDNLGKEKQLTIVETSTDNAQARYIPQWLESLGDKAGSETAIVLCDETLLQPVLHCIPADRTAGVNITMGYPMSQTPLFSLVSALLDMQRTAAANGGRFTLALVSRVLANPLVSCLSGKALETLEELRAARRMYPETGDLQNDPVLSSLFRITTDNTSLLQYILDILKSLVPVLDSQEDTPFKPLMQESLYRTYTQTNRLRTLIEEGRLNIQTETLCRLVRTMLASTTVPFHGEPAVGMQIMGLIETRNLDFRNVLVLSAGEGSLPSAGGNASFIPYNVRKAFNLTSMQDKSAVSSYNFYHLLQRAENVTMVYNGNSDAPGIGKGLISRYLLQLTVSGRPIRRISLMSDRTDSVTQPVSVEKTPEILRRLCERYDCSNPRTYLSPSALKKYVTCPLSFYLSQVCGLKKPDESDTEIDAAKFGTLLHRSAELAYDRLKEDGTVTSDSLDRLLGDSDALNGIVCQAFNDCFFNGKTVKLQDYSGTQSVNHGVILKYLKQILTLDARCYAPFDYIEGETDRYEHFLEIPHPLETGRTYRIRLKGIIDRMDRKGDVYRIVDYKTGTKHDCPKNFEEVFSAEKFHEHAFQIFYYAYVLCCQEEFKDRKIAPTLLYTRSTSKPNPDDLYYRIGDHQIMDFSAQCREFETRLNAIVCDIFNPETPFAPAQDEKACRYCDFKAICHPGKDMEPKW